MSKYKFYCVDNVILHIRHNTYLCIKIDYKWYTCNSTEQTLYAFIHYDCIYELYTCNYIRIVLGNIYMYMKYTFGHLYRNQYRLEIVCICITIAFFFFNHKMI